MNLFAYGTLMTPEGLRESLGDRADALGYQVARLAGWRRVWNAYREEWNGGVLNIERQEGAQVIGVLVTGLTEQDFDHLDRGEASHLPRESVYVEPDSGEPVPAQIYYRRRGNHTGRPSTRYLGIVVERARQAGPAVLENLRTGAVDPSGLPYLLP
jgi:hypothetical protein